MRVLAKYRGFTRVVSAAVMGLVLAGCDAALKENTFPPMSDVVTSVSTVDGTVTASYLSGDRPVASTGPTVTVNGVPSAINGGSLRSTVTSATPFTRVVVSMQYLDGFYEINLPAPVTSVDLLMTLSQLASRPTIGLLYGAAASGGPLGAPLARNVTMIQVGAGDVQVSVAWDAPTDVDLHVTDPSSEEIYFGNKTSASGGTLDLDSNAACTIDNVNNENVTWPVGGAPTGQYSVNLVYWSACSQAASNYTVTIVVRGQAPQVFSGTLTTANSSLKIPIGTFTR
ncbi:MAG: hypothetical protein ABI679_13295 [Gemmatimonadota bacterium]